jgi:hypothetical protein
MLLIRLDRWKASSLTKQRKWRTLGRESLMLLSSLRRRKSNRSIHSKCSVTLFTIKLKDSSKSMKASAMRIKS